MAYAVCVDRNGNLNSNFYETVPQQRNAFLLWDNLF